MTKTHWSILFVSSVSYLIGMAVGVQAERIADRARTNQRLDGYIEDAKDSNEPL